VPTRIVLTILVLLLAAGCGSAEGEEGSGEIVAAFYPLAWAAERVAGEDVRNLTPPGVEPHDFELSPQDVGTVGEARAVFYLEHFQPALEEAIESADANGVNLLEGLDLLEPAEEEAHEEHEEHEGEARDPHVWLDPVRFADVVERLGRELERPEAAAELGGELRKLDRELRRGLADCERHELVTSHAAFGYLAERYGLEQVAITGASPEAEPTPAELRNLVEEVRSHGATTVFFETLVSPRLAQTVAREVGAETAVLNPLEGLTEEQLADGEDYFSVMRENLAALRKALGCR
jgi:zinc transport system substrate-binding protein